MPMFWKTETAKAEKEYYRKLDSLTATLIREGTPPHLAEEKAELIMMRSAAAAANVDSLKLKNEEK